MDCSQDLLQLDSEISRINIPRDSVPFLPVLPSPEISEEPLEYGLNTPPVTPVQSPHAFLKEERWLFSLPPVGPTLSTHSEVTPPSDAPDKAESGQNSTCHHGERRNPKHPEEEQPTLHHSP